MLIANHSPNPTNPMDSRITYPNPNPTTPMDFFLRLTVLVRTMVPNYLLPCCPLNSWQMSWFY